MTMQLNSVSLYSKSPALYLVLGTLGTMRSDVERDL